jgi:hypothetical protein
MTRIPFLLAAVAALACASCATPNQYEVNYTRTASEPKLKKIPASQVAVEEFSDEAAFHARIAALRKQGLVMRGHSLFNGEYIAPAFAKNFAAEEGCERVLLIRRKIGKGVGTRMETASYTPPTMGFVNTTLSTPSGRNYSAVSTIYNPGQQTYVPQDYTYDAYRHGAAFFSRPGGPTSSSTP